ncbi:MAG TPA: aldo/keto reductase [Nitrospiria bacterium]|nr:aldo/keto reductase [Nitrospiria bacterium]
MRYRPLGKTGVNVSEIGFGSWSIGGKDYGPTDDRGSVRALQRAFELGITFYDTADMYGDGRSEELIARALKPHYRQIFVATKVGHNFYAGDYRKEFGKDYVRFAVDESLKRLSTDRIDLYQLHNPSEEILRQGEIFEIMRALVQEGKIRFWGVSVSSADAARLAMGAGASTLQLVHNLLRSGILREIVEEVKKHSPGVIARTPLEYGLLSGKYREGDTFHPSDHRANRWSPEAFAERLAQVEKFRFLVRGEIHSLSEAAIRYVLAHPLVSTVIPGIKTVAQVDELVKGADGDGYLDPQALIRIAEIQEGIKEPA